MSTEAMGSYDPTLEWENGWIAVWRKCEWFGFNVASVRSGLSGTVKLILLYGDKIRKGNPAKKDEAEFMFHRPWLEKDLSLDAYLQMTQVDQERFLWEDAWSINPDSMVASMRAVALKVLKNLRPQKTDKK